MADSSLAASRSRRSRTDRSGRSAALEKLKAVKSGQKAKFELIEDEKNLFEDVSQEEYNQRVSDRRTGFIVGGDSDYKDDGYEIFDEEYEEAEEQERKNKPKVSYKAPKSSKEMKEEASKSGNIRSMFLAAPHKRKAETASLEDDNVLKLLMRSKGFKDADDDDDDEENIPIGNVKKKQKAEEANIGASRQKKQNTEATTSVAKECLQQKVKNTTEDNVLQGNKEVSIMEVDDEPEDEDEIQPDVIETTEDTKPEILAVKLEGPAVDVDELIPAPQSNSKECKEVDTKAFNEEDFEDQPEEKPTLSSTTLLDLPKTKNTAGQEVFRVFWFDAYEDAFAHPGTVYLFGKTEVVGGFVSASVVVKNIPKKLFFLPKEVKNESGITSAIPFNTVYDEVIEVLKRHDIKEFRCRESEKKFVFFTHEVPRSANYVEVHYVPTKSTRALAADLTGRTFSKVFGTTSSSLEALILDRKLKGPSWLEVREPKSAKLRNTTCKFELECAELGNIVVSETQSDPPNLSILTLQARVIRNEKNSKDEVVMVAGLMHESYPLTKPPPAKLFTQHFCFVTAPGGKSLPFDFEKEIASEKIKIKACDKERMLVSQLNAKISKCDPDIIVGHDVTSFTIPAILSAMERHKIVKPSALSRLYRSNVQHLNVAKLDRSQLLPGRVICDTKLSAKELIQAKSYELGDLVGDVFAAAAHDEIPPDAVKEMFCRTSSLKQLCRHLMTECRFVVKLLAELNVLPLAAQLTMICGNTLTQTLQKGRALRNEYLLLHAFTEKSYIVPDKENRRQKKKPQVKHDAAADATAAGDNTSTDVKKKAGPSYAGGLVLDPIVGFYDSMVLCMDFNSLYPSIIQEYNLCFTTCTLTPPEDNPTADPSDWEAQIPQVTIDTGVLPAEIRKLVESRRAVKSLLKTPNLSKEKLLQYDIRQKALKLTANSMYGCLGFQGSRFYAKPIAALITHRGRDILMSAKSLAESMGYSIIYGDTDSIMVNTGTRDLSQVNEIGTKIRVAINKQYKQLEIEVDDVFKAMLLLKKKKYAACSVKFDRDGTLTGQKIEVKGLDIVRRDWSELARKTGRYVVDTLLKGELSADDAVDAVHSHLRQVAQMVNENTLSFEHYLITKQLTKNVDDYQDSKSQPHVIVAKRFNMRGARKLRAGDTVQYVICVDGTDNPHTQRAYSKEEIESKEFANKLTIDKVYYISQQVFPVVSRLIDPIQGTDAAVVAQCLGLDPSKYNRRTNFDPSGMVDSEMSVGISLLLPQSLDSDLFQNVEAFSLNCTKCETPISVDGPVFRMVDDKLKFLFSDCGHCHSPLLPQLNQLCNQLTRQLQTLQAESEKIIYVCQSCKHQLADVLCNVHEEEIPPCPSCGDDSLQLQSQTFQAYAQLRYWAFMFDRDYYARKFSDCHDTLDSDSVKLITDSFRALIDRFLKSNGFTTFSLRSYMGKLPSCNFKKRPRIRPDLDIP